MLNVVDDEAKAREMATTAAGLVSDKRAAVGSATTFTTSVPGVADACLRGRR
jgi:hypothetical protein